MTARLRRDWPDRPAALAPADALTIPSCRVN
jgi:hypothetical protein